MAFKRDVYDKLSRDEQDGLRALFWTRNADDEGGLVTWPTEDAAYSPEEFRAIELCAMNNYYHDVHTAAAARALLYSGGIHSPSKAKVEAVEQMAKVEFWLHW